MYLRDIAIYADESIGERFRGGFVQRFHRESCCVVELYLSHLNRQVKTVAVGKVQLEFTDVTTTPDPAGAKTLLNVVVAQWLFDFGMYAVSEAATKKRMIAAALHEAMLWLADLFQWDHASLIKAYNHSVKQRLEFNGFSKKSWRSPSGRFVVRIFFQFEPDDVELFAVIYKGRSKIELARKRLGVGVPEMGCLNTFLRGGRWKSETEFVLTSTDFRQHVWSADFSDVMG